MVQEWRAGMTDARKALQRAQREAAASFGAEGPRCEKENRMKGHLFAVLRRRSKYGAVPTEVDGIRFASKAEGRRYTELKLMERAGVIRGLKLQPRYELYAANLDAPDKPVAVCVYVADYEFWERVDGRAGDARTTWELITEDCKGAVTPVFRIKQKWFFACYGREIRVTE